VNDGQTDRSDFINSAVSYEYINHQSYSFISIKVDKTQHYNTAKMKNKMVKVVGQS